MEYKYLDESETASLLKENYRMTENTIGETVCPTLKEPAVTEAITH